MHSYLPSFPTRRSSDLANLLRGSHQLLGSQRGQSADAGLDLPHVADGLDDVSRARFALGADHGRPFADPPRSEEHTSELQSLRHLVCRLLLETKKTN